MTEPCAHVQDHLLRRWADDIQLPPTPEPAWLADHLASCSRCRGHAGDLTRLDAVLASGFRAVGGIVGVPSDGQIQETIRRVREEPVEVETIRRIRRPVRVILWGVFYAFTLVACCVLAVALYRALKGL